MAVADRWRAVDPVEWIPCDWAARILRLAGQRELAWGYLTSPSSLRDAGAAEWIELARQQHWQRDYDLAERAFAVALSWEPANAAIVRERALNQCAARTRDAARTLLQQFDKGVWEERYKAFQLRVQQALHAKRD